MIDLDDLGVEAPPERPTTPLERSSLTRRWTIDVRNGDGDWIPVTEGDRHVAEAAKRYRDTIEALIGTRQNRLIQRAVLGAYQTDIPWTAFRRFVLMTADLEPGCAQLPVHVALCSINCDDPAEIDVEALARLRLDDKHAGRIVLNIEAVTKPAEKSDQIDVTFLVSTSKQHQVGT